LSWFVRERFELSIARASAASGGIAARIQYPVSCPLGARGDFSRIWREAHSRRFWLTVSAGFFILSSPGTFA